MAKGNSRNKRMKPKDSGRRGKKKISPISSDNVPYIDYKDVDLLRRFLSDRAKIRSRRVTGNDSQQQREVARAIKNAREMGLIAYTSRVTTQRRGGRRDGDGGGRGRPDRDRDRDRDQAPTEEVDETPLAEETVPVEVEETVEA